MLPESNLPIEEPGGPRPQEPGDSGEPELPDGSQSGEQSGAEEEVPPVPGSEQAMTFYDASKVPLELRATFQEMQANLTKKFQDLAEQRRGLEPQLQKAQLFDQMLADPEVVDVLNQLRLQRSGQGRGSGGEAEGDERVSQDDPRLRNLETQLAELQRQTEQRQIQAQVLAEREALTQKYPDWPKYRNWMGAVLEENPNRDLEALYLIAKARVEQHRQSAKPKPPVVEAPSTPASRGAPSHNKKPSSWEEAMQMTLDERGLTQRDLR